MYVYTFLDTGFPGHCPNEIQSVLVNKFAQWIGIDRISKVIILSFIHLFMGYGLDLLRLIHLYVSYLFIYLGIMGFQRKYCNHVGNLSVRGLSTLFLFSSFLNINMIIAITIIITF